jgi:nanoRNase/pAp phosphatase (c-di-AMP/oligoRNAs hydrolase)
MRRARRKPVSSPRGRGSARDLLAVLEPSDPILILPHENPDPDALASAAGLRALIRHALDVRAIIARSGTIGRPENRALVSALQIRLEPAVKVLAGFQGSIILVDTQPGRKNNALPPGVLPAAVIDHHSDWAGNDGVPFVDLREHYGATTTIVTEYLQELEVPIDGRLATALFYGISSETLHLGRETQSSDIAASQFLYPFVDKRLLGAIEVPRLSPSYFGLIGDAVQSTILCDDVAITLLSEVPYPDAVAEVADLFVRLDDASWALCLGRHKEFLYLSLRSNEVDAKAGLLLASLLPSGSAGGHDMIAGGRTDLEGRDWEEVARSLTRRILEELGRTGQRRGPIVSARSAADANSGPAVRMLAELPLSLGGKGTKKNRRGLPDDSRRP